MHRSCKGVGQEDDSRLRLCWGATSSSFFFLVSPLAPSHLLLPRLLLLEVDSTEFSREKLYRESKLFSVRFSKDQTIHRMRYLLKKVLPRFFLEMKEIRQKGCKIFGDGDCTESSVWLQ